MSVRDETQKILVWAFGAGNVASWEWSKTRPRFSRTAEQRQQCFEGMFRELSIGRQLSSEDRQQYGCVHIAAELELVVACDCGRARRIVVVERTHARVAPDHIARCQLLFEVAIDTFAE